MAVLNEIRSNRVWGRVVFGLLLIGAFSTVVLAYFFTEYLLSRFDVRRRVFIGEHRPLTAILWTNVVSFLVVCASSFIVMFAAGINHYADAALICLCAQSVWLSQHLWFYHRDHLRVR